MGRTARGAGDGSEGGFRRRERWRIVPANTGERWKGRSGKTTTQGMKQMGSMHPVQVIAVTGGKGGVGKTNVSVNLALALADLGRRVMLLDADLGLANVDVLLGLTPKRTLADVIEDAANCAMSSSSVPVACASFLRPPARRAWCTSRRCSMRADPGVQRYQRQSRCPGRRHCRRDRRFGGQFRPRRAGGAAGRLRRADLDHRCLRPDQTAQPRPRHDPLPGPGQHGPQPAGRTQPVRQTDQGH